jgi:FKBP-type peptidyl-prolyl cis-trans isomerase
MRIIAIVFALFISGVCSAQSKKDLQQQVKKLQEENAALKKSQDTKPATFSLDSDQKKASYGMGVLLAMNVQSQGADSLDITALSEGFNDVFAKEPLLMDQQECMNSVQNFMQAVRTHKSEHMKETGKKFLEENKNKPGVKVTSTGLQYEVVKAGNGKTPGPNDKVTVHYTGKLTDGSVFDSSAGREPVTFGVTQVIPGWTEALQLMKEGDKWMIYIPENLGYGERGAGAQIPPYSTLVFEIELIKVN